MKKLSFLACLIPSFIFAMENYQFPRAVRCSLIKRESDSSLNQNLYITGDNFDINTSLFNVYKRLHAHKMKWQALVDLSIKSENSSIINTQL